MKPHLKQFGLSHTRVYKAWRNMHERCENPRTNRYEYYGGMGISVCPDWKEFKPFYDWAMANGYRDHLTLDRRENGKGYSPDNCRWATRLEQARNKRIPVRPGKKKRTSISMDRSIYRKAMVLCQFLQMSLSRLVEFLINEEWQRRFGFQFNYEI